VCRGGNTKRRGKDKIPGRSGICLGDFFFQRFSFSEFQRFRDTPFCPPVSEGDSIPTGKEIVMRSILRTLGILVLACALVGTVLAQDKPKKEMKQPTPEEQQKMMADYMKLIAPGPHHKLLEKMAGDHATTGKMWMGPGAEAMTMEPGTEKSEMILGGRYLRSHHGGNMMGMPFEGEGTMAYDNFRQKYLMSWLDNFGTTISAAAGDYDEATKTLTLMGKMDDPQTGEKDKDVKYVYRFMDDKTTIFEMWVMSGTPFKTMEMTYTKK
jgi:hypothetical protein